MVRRRGRETRYHTGTIRDMIIHDLEWTRIVEISGVGPIKWCGYMHCAKVMKNKQGKFVWTFWNRDEQVWQ